MSAILLQHKLCYGRQINSKLENQENDKSKYRKYKNRHKYVSFMINGETAVSNPWQEYHLGFSQSLHNTRMPILPSSF